MSKEAMQQALEALELHAKQYPHMQKGYTVDAVTALQEALAQPAQQKPTSICERWNIERDGADLLVCFNQHDKGEKCEYQRFVPAPQLAITRFAALVAQHERDACALVCESQDASGSVNQRLMQERCADAIRARAEKGGE